MMSVKCSEATLQTIQYNRSSVVHTVVITGISMAISGYLWYESNTSMRRNHAARSNTCMCKKSIVIAVSRIYDTNLYLGVQR